MNDDARLRLLGLGARAHRVVIGVSGVRAKLQEQSKGSGRGLACVVLAADASERTQDKVGRLAVARGVPVLVGPTAERLGAGLGRPAVQAVGVNDPDLARGLARLSEE